MSGIRSQLSTDVAAPADLLFDLARNVERWPSLLPHYDLARVVGRGPNGERVVEFVARRPLVPLLGLEMPVAWRSRTWADEDERKLRFEHLGGATGGMSVTWRIEPTETGCRVTIEHVFGARAASAIERLFIRPIAGRTLASFKAIAEAVAAGQRDEGNR